MSRNTESPVDVDEAIARINSRGAKVRREQLEQTLSQLQDNGELTADQRLAVEKLSERLVERLLAVPRASLQDSAQGADDERIETAISLFE
ncbi:Glutamyl-tRNAGlu reductase, dimerisation domain [Haloarcula vallismortis]|uniref:Glutamyl-tRNAGlu reductase n=2 Tax=Haloarcula vallismortis TaxID=28442 RepID=M0JMY0_HALVA|nr:glutamyl-tRNAGlu reductase [Haloarcula vallismortis]EMA09015.1 glutamyl-tRNAGlu reductase [Haloarcula vallismortis ATCC 29715]SDX09428.1 Glutamyl-tRNAGlu reductase, dimerisation domain [Haloarcula vallismortis]